MKTRNTKIALLLMAVFIFTVTCTNPRSETLSKEQEAPKPVDTSLNNAALFLAGKELPQDSPLTAYTQKSYYTSYKANITTGWEKFQKPNRDRMKVWWENHAFSNSHDTVLYPFSGPDILNALLFYPEAETIIMFGLENPGAIPHPEEMSEAQIQRSLNALRNSLGTILRVNFFRTKGMEKNIATTPFNGIAGVLMFFLATEDYKITGARWIVIDENSEIVDATEEDKKIQWQNPPQSRIPGVEISFQKDGQDKVLRYFMLNVIDYALQQHSPNFVPFLDKNGPYSTVIKSASYLMHNADAKFVKIRNAVLSNSDQIVQDDSGVPLRFLEEAGFDVSFHGYYDQPIPLFQHRTQPEMRERFKKGTGPLPFSYGYDYRAGESNLITAEKKKQ